MENIAKGQPSFFIKLIFFFSLNFFVNWFLKEKLEMPIRIGEVTLISICSFILTKGFFSVIISPAQFFTALKERIIRFFGLIIILIIRVYGVVMAITYRFWSVIIRLLIIVIYWVSPIDLVADIFLGIGQIDDLAVTLLMGLWVVRDLRKHISEKTKNVIENVNKKTKIETAFP